MAQIILDRVKGTELTRLVRKLDPEAFYSVEIRCLEESLEEELALKRPLIRVEEAKEAEAAAAGEPLEPWQE
jgi:hypothetical protein